MLRGLLYTLGCCCIRCFDHSWQAAMCSEQAQGHLSKVRLSLHVSLSLSVSGLCHEPWLTRGNVHPAPAHRRTAVCLQHSKEDARNAQGQTWARARHLASQGSSAAATPSTGAGRPRAAASARASAQRILPFCRRHVQRTCMHGLFTSVTQNTGRMLRFAGVTAVLAAWQTLLHVACAQKTIARAWNMSHLASTLS